MSWKNFVTAMSLLLFTGVASTLAQSEVRIVTVTPNQTTTVSGNLSEGSMIADLSFAWSSSIACFPGTQQSKFTGNHVFYAFEMGPRSVANVTVTPKKPGTNLSIYGYQLGAGKIVLPDELTRAVTCEADHKWDYPKRGKVQGDERTMSFNSVGNPYTVVVAVVGASGLSSADFTLSVNVRQ